MEEKSKEIKMEPNKAGENQEKQKLSYDELKELAQKVFDENRYLTNELYKARQTIGMFNRLDYLLRIVEVNNSAKDWRFDDDFIHMCMHEIETAMTPPEKGEEDTSKSEEN